MRGRDEKQMEGGGKSWRRAGKTMMGEGEMGKGGGDWGEEREMEEEKGGKYREKEQEKQGREIFSCLFPSPFPNKTYPESTLTFPFVGILIRSCCFIFSLSINTYPKNKYLKKDISKYHLIT